MQEVRLVFLGFGNVGKALAKLLLKKESELKDKFQLGFKVTGIATGRHGQAVNPDGIDLALALETDDYSKLGRIAVGDARDFIAKARGDVLFENSPVNYETGQPAVDHLRWALEHGLHAITANKGPVVHAYRELSGIARQAGRRFLFESTVMDGAPIFSLFRGALPGANLISFKGVLNSTTNMILTRMEDGASFESAVRYCQEIGIAETDPSGDIDGWDAAVKVSALATVLMETPLKPSQVDRTGIREISLESVQQAKAQGMRWKLVCSLEKDGARVHARVHPELVGTDSPLYGATGTTSIVQFQTDVLGLLSVVEADPGPHTTAYGLFADFLTAMGKTS